MTMIAIAATPTATKSQGKSRLTRLGFSGLPKEGFLGDFDGGGAADGNIRKTLQIQSNYTLKTRNRGAHLSRGA